MRMKPSKELDLPSAGLKGLLRGKVVAFFLLLTTIPSKTGEVQSFFSPVSVAEQQHETVPAYEPRQESPQRGPGRDDGPRRVFKDRITPHWFADNTRFWYRNDLRDGAKEFIVVDAENGMRQPAFDHQKLAAALSRAAATQFNADRLPFSEIEFIEQAKAIRFDAADKTWRCDLNSYECAAIVERADSIPAKSDPLPRQRARVSGKGAYDSPNADEPGDARDQTPSPAD